MGETADPRRTDSLTQAPKTIAYQHIDFDVLGTLSSFYVRTVSVLGSDRQTAELGLSGRTGKISTILLVGANPLLWPSVLAHFIRKDRSTVAKLFEGIRDLLPADGDSAIWGFYHVEGLR